MLVVIAIIGILASLLLPALNKAREKSRETLCSSNLKQITLATFSYAMDFNEYLPPPVTHWSKPWSVLIFEVIPNYNVFKCPSDNFSRDLSTGRHVRTYSCNSAPHSWGYDYAPFGTFNNATQYPVTWPYKLNQVGVGGTKGNTVSDIILYGEKPSDTYDAILNFTETTNTTVETWNFCTLNFSQNAMVIHKLKGNFSFVDGHTRLIKYPEYKSAKSYANNWVWK